MAGAAIGGSHLIQSTRAGADYRFELVWVIIIALVFKYPFFEYGPRYTASTGENLLEGYLRLGKWAIAVFVTFTLITMFVVEAALVLVTAGLAGQMFGIKLTPITWSIILFAIFMLILMLGKYPILDKLMKVIIIVLVLSTIFAVIAGIVHGSSVSDKIASPTIWNLTGISFVIALMGWMPSIIDISVWYSLWAIERRKQTHHAPTLSEALFDFNLGYFITSILALAFLTLGALVMYGTGETFSDNGVKFAGQLVSLYTRTLGTWTGPIIIVAAFTTMFSTTLAVTDAYPRVLRCATELVSPNIIIRKIKGDNLYYGFMIMLAIVTLLIIGFSRSGIISMIYIATTLSFLTTPVLAYINYRVIMDPHVPKEAIPPRHLRILSWAGIIFWGGLAVVFIFMRFVYAG